MSNSSGFGAATSFHGPDRIDRSGAQPNSTSGAKDSAYMLAPRQRGAAERRRQIDAVDVRQGAPSSRMTVGATSASVTASATRVPA